MLPSQPIQQPQALLPSLPVPSPCMSIISTTLSTMRHQYTLIILKNLNPYFMSQQCRARTRIVLLRWRKLIVKDVEDLLIDC